MKGDRGALWRCPPRPPGAARTQRGPRARSSPRPPWEVTRPGGGRLGVLLLALSYRDLSLRGWGRAQRAIHACAGGQNPRGISHGSLLPAHRSACCLLDSAWYQRREFLLRVFSFIADPVKSSNAKGLLFFGICFYSACHL